MPVPQMRPAAVRPVYHVITPGDHFSPLTGSAIPTVVHGLATGARLAGDDARFPQNVIVQSGTFTPRYTSANAIEFSGSGYPSRNQRVADAARARLGLRRTASYRHHKSAIDSIRNAPPGVVVAHNAPIVAEFDGSHHHTTVLYAHNNVLRTYSKAEAARVVSGAQWIVCVSEFLADEIRTHLPRSLHERIRVVRNGVDTAQFSPAQPFPDATPSTGLQVIFLGRTIPDKGADILVEAVTLLPRADIETLIVGSHGFDASALPTPYERQFRERARFAHSSIQFLPFVNRHQLPALLRSANVLVVPSRWNDPCPLTIGEGLATGLIVVAARVGGIPEIIGDAGILVSADDPQELSEALNRIADDAELRARFRAKAVARSQENDWEWSWRQFADVLLEGGAAG